MVKAYVTAREYLRSIITREDGQGMVEYALVVGVISIALVLAFVNAGVAGAIGTFAGKIVTKLNGITL